MEIRSLADGILYSIIVVAVHALWVYMMWVFRDPLLAAILAAIDFVFVLPFNLITNCGFWLSEHLDGVYWVLFTLHTIMILFGVVCLISEGYGYSKRTWFK